VLPLLLPVECIVEVRGLSTLPDAIRVDQCATWGQPKARTWYPESTSFEPILRESLLQPRTFELVHGPFFAFKVPSMALPVLATATVSSMRLRLSSSSFAISAGSAAVATMSWCLSFVFR
jgi:hypothetical protein